MKYHLQMGPVQIEKKKARPMKDGVYDGSAERIYLMACIIVACVCSNSFSRASRSTMCLVVLDTPCSSQKMTWMRRKRIS